MAKLDIVPFEVLSKMMSFMERKDIIALSDTNRYLRNAVEFSYEAMDVDLKLVNEKRIYLKLLGNECIERKKDIIHVDGLPLVLKFLRLYGPRTRFLVLDFNMACIEHVQIVLSYISRYCRNINRLALGYLKFNIGRSLKRILSTVTILEFYECDVYGKLCHVNKLFPNIEYLNIFSENFFEKKSELIKPYKNLKYIFVNSDTETIDINALQRLNPLVVIRDEFPYDYNDYLVSDYEFFPNSP